MTRIARVMTRLNAEEAACLLKLTKENNKKVGKILRESLLLNIRLHELLTKKDWGRIAEAAKDKATSMEEVIAMCVRFCIEAAGKFR